MYVAEEISVTGQFHKCRYSQILLEFTAHMRKLKSANSNEVS